MRTVKKPLDSTTAAGYKGTSLSVTLRSEPTRCIVCHKRIGAGYGERRGYGDFCDRTCIHRHLTAPNPATEQFRSEDAQKPVEEENVNMATLKPTVKAKAKVAKVAAPKAAGVAPAPKAIVKKAAAPAPKAVAPKLGLVRDGETRPFMAGQVLRKLGTKDGVTEKMVAELNKAYGDENTKESTFALRNAWHAIRGFSAS